MMRILICLLWFLPRANAEESLLLKEVDKLDSRQAQQLVTKLQSKFFRPIPEGFFTKLSLSLMLGARQLDANEFEGELNPKFRNENDFSMGRNTSLQIRWPVGAKNSLGIEFGTLAQSSSRQIETDLYQEISVRSLWVQLLYARRLVNTERWLADISLGAGGVAAKVNRVTSSDSSSTSQGSVSSHNYNYSGTNFVGSVRINTGIKLNHVFSLGIAWGYQYEVVKELKRSSEIGINRPERLDLTGPFAGILISYNL